MSFWTPEGIKAACGGAWVARGPGPADLTGVSTDTRTIKPGNVFVALRGARHDAHAFVRDAVSRGAGMLVVERPEALGPETRAIPAVRVPDAGRALLKLASAYRRTLETTRVIAIGGSNGKTTTTRLIHAALSTRLRGSAPQGSFNNAVGVPLTILGAQSSDQYLLCEVGTSGRGEIAMLGEVIEPDIAVITSIGREHLEGLGSLEGVLREEASLLQYVRPGGSAIITADAPGLRELAAPIPNVVTFGRSPDADLRLTHAEHVGAGDAPGASATADALAFTVNERQRYTLRLVGEHNALNALAALAVARRMGIPDDASAAALAEAAPVPMRLERLRIGPVDVLNDAYNANPESMEQALRTLAGVSRAPASPPAPTPPRRVAVLGDMLELGPAAPDLHRQLGQALRQHGWADAAVLVGHLALHIAQGLHEEDGAPAWDSERVLCLSDLDERQARLAASWIRPGDVVLLKASRGKRLERLIPALHARFASGSLATGTASSAQVESSPHDDPRPQVSAPGVRAGSAS